MFQWKQLVLWCSSNFITFLETENKENGIKQPATTDVDVEAEEPLASEVGEELKQRDEMNDSLARESIILGTSFEDTSEVLGNLIMDTFF